ncbi:MAG TPA: glycosyltransferase family 4 protein [Polyangia bacterium]|nr:glycosyltransferase family 4 protein [Polyangia bacterium]
MTIDATPPRLLYVVSLFPCWSETFIVREITGLIAAGADVRILSLKAPHEKLVQPAAEALLPRARHPLGPAPAALARGRAIATHPLSFASSLAQITRGLAHKPVDLAKSVEALARGAEQLDWVRGFDPHVIHAHWGTFPSTVAWALARVLDKPFGFTCHAHDIFVNDHLMKVKIESAAVPVTISRFNVEYLAQHVTPLARERLEVVHCGVDLPAVSFKEGGREPGLILAVGRLDPIKGFDVLVDAIAILAKEGKRARVKLVGSGPLEGDLKARIAQHGLGDSFQLVGALKEAEVRAALHEASIFCLPSVVTSTGDRDGIPVSLMEAMAAGTPVVSTRVSGIPELVDDGREGLLVPERDARALARAIATLLDDPARGAAFATEARKKVERDFDARVESKKMYDLFQRARRT